MTERFRYAFAALEGVKRCRPGHRQHAATKLPYLTGLCTPPRLNDFHTFPCQDLVPLPGEPPEDYVVPATAAPQGVADGQGQGRG